jgi:hypothetical protein
MRSAERKWIAASEASADATILELNVEGIDDKT